MKENTITFETAILARDKGFIERTSSCYDVNGKQYFGMDQNNTMGELVYSAPTQSLLQKWLREVHDIHLVVVANIRNQYFYETYQKEDLPYSNDEIYSLMSGKAFKTYEEAIEKGLYEALKLINND